MTGPGAMKSLSITVSLVNFCLNSDVISVYTWEGKLLEEGLITDGLCLL